MNPCTIDSESRVATERLGARWWEPPPAPPPRFLLWSPGVAPPPAAYSGSPRAAALTIRTAALGGRGGRLGTQRGSALAGEKRGARALAGAGAAAGV